MPTRPKRLEEMTQEEKTAVYFGDAVPQVEMTEEEAREQTRQTQWVYGWPRAIVEAVAEGRAPEHVKREFMDDMRERAKAGQP